MGLDTPYIYIYTCGCVIMKIQIIIHIRGFPHVPPFVDHAVATCRRFMGSGSPGPAGSPPLPKGHGPRSEPSEGNIKLTRRRDITLMEDIAFQVRRGREEACLGRAAIRDPRRRVNRCPYSVLMMSPLCRMPYDV